MPQLVQTHEGLSVPPHDYVAITYVASGNGAGEIETISYYVGGDSGAVCAVVTLSYDSNHKLIAVTKV